MGLRSGGARSAPSVPEPQSSGTPALPCRRLQQPDTDRHPLFGPIPLMRVCPPRRSSALHAPGHQQWCHSPSVRGGLFFGGGGGALLSAGGGGGFRGVFRESP